MTPGAPVLEAALAAAEAQDLAEAPVLNDYDLAAI